MSCQWKYSPTYDAPSKGALGLLKRVGVCIPLFLPDGDSDHMHTLVSYFHRGLRAISAWRAVAEKISIVIITNNPIELENRLQGHMPPHVSLASSKTCLHWSSITPICLSIRGVESDEVKNIRRNAGPNIRDKEPDWYFMPYVSRHVFANMRASPSPPTSYVYLEHDIEINVHALLSWAEDTLMVEPLGYIRSFFTLEDVSRKDTKSSWVNVQSTQSDFIGNVSDGFVSRAFKVKNNPFVHPSQPYSPCFAASRAQMDAFMASSLWLKADNRLYDVRAGAASNIHYALGNATQFKHAAVLPLLIDSNGRPTLHPNGAVFHLPNKYVALQNSRLAKICMSDAVLWYDSFHLSSQPTIFHDYFSGTICIRSPPRTGSTLHIISQNPFFRVLKSGNTIE